jgi:hypothetical protein
MTKSRTALIALAGLAASPAVAQPVAAGNEAPSFSLHDLIQRQCPAGSDEITVCGRRERPERYRLPLPVAAAPSPRDQAGGEQRAALAIDTSRCTTVGRDQNCGSVDFLGMGIMIVREIVAGLERRRD